MTQSPPRTITVADARNLHGKDNITFIDVREPAEIAQGRIAGAQAIPRATLPSAISDTQTFTDASRTYVFYCAAGGRAGMAAQTAQDMGLENVLIMETGFGNWKADGGPSE